ncbi:MAG: aminotransferase class III-fold pyridoxal phosphate-dependent enzyme [Pseudomonadota bacterium]
MLKLLTQDEWARRAAAVLPGAGFGNFDAGVFIREGKGARVTDEDGRAYIDYLIGSGPMVLGHGHPEVLEAVYEQLPRGMTFFANSTPGVELAEEIVRAVPCAEQIRYVSSGSEADMFAIRLARAFTGRSKIVKFEGGYHGMCNEGQMSLSPARMVNFPAPVPDSAGIPESVERETLVAPYNDVGFIEGLFAEHGDDIAGIIVEPLQRIIPPEPGFLEALRAICDKHGALLIFDEVVTGFRFAYGGAQEIYGVTPDLCTLGKIIGGGFPLAAIAGSERIMRHFDKAAVGADAWLMQVGTLSGNPIAAAAGLKTMEILRRDGQYETFRATGERLQTAMSTALAGEGAPHSVVGHPTLFDIVFAAGPVRTYRDTVSGHAGAAGAWNASLRRDGILKPPTKVYVSLALEEADLVQTEEAIGRAAEAAAAAL